MSVIILFLLLLFIVIIAIVTVYCITAAYQQTLKITVPFNETYRYIPNLSGVSKFKLDSIKVTITGSIKKNTDAASTIVPGNNISRLINENIILPYSNCLLIHEANVFLIEETELKRYCLTKEPTLERLSVMFFSILAPIMPSIGCQLVSITLISQGIKVSNSRYKMSTYKL